MLGGITWNACKLAPRMAVKAVRELVALMPSHALGVICLHEASFDSDCGIVVDERIKKDIKYIKFENYFTIVATSQFVIASVHLKHGEEDTIIADLAVCIRTLNKMIPDAGCLFVGVDLNTTSQYQIERCIGPTLYPKLQSHTSTSMNKVFLLYAGIQVVSG